MQINHLSGIKTAEDKEQGTEKKKMGPGGEGEGVIMRNYLNTMQVYGRLIWNIRKKKPTAAHLNAGPLILFKLTNLPKK